MLLSDWARAVMVNHFVQRLYALCNCLERAFKNNLPDFTAGLLLAASPIHALHCSPLHPVKLNPRSLGCNTPEGNLSSHNRLDTGRPASRIRSTCCRPLRRPQPVTQYIDTYVDDGDHSHRLEDTTVST